MEATQLAFLAQLGKLQHLSLQLPINGFPQSTWMLPGLRSLVLKGVTYMHLPDEFAQLSLLSRLDLTDCGLQRMPAVICQCQGASYLRLMCILCISPHTRKLMPTVPKQASPTSTEQG
jgi:hypothetical protein